MTGVFKVICGAFLEGKLKQPRHEGYHVLLTERGKSGPHSPGLAKTGRSCISEVALKGRSGTQDLETWYLRLLSVTGASEEKTPGDVLAGYDSTSFLPG